MNKLKLLITVLIGVWNILNLANGKIVNCYYGTWSNYRPGDGKFEPSNIDPNLCTHLSYSFFGITPAGEFKVLDPWFDLDNGLSGISRTMKLKRINPKLKVLAVVGGWNEGSEKYSRMAADTTKRQLFIKSALRFIEQHGFDGLDLDWEYPGQRGGSAEDKVNFVTLLRELKDAFKPFNMELGIAVSASTATASTSYDIPNIAKLVDFINIMSYDFAGTWDNAVGFNAPMKGQGERNVPSAINYWLKQGAPVSKLILGLAFYGRSFKLSNREQITPGSSITGPGDAGPYTRENGFIGYNEICVLDKSWSFKWSNEHQVPFVHKSNQWIGYDNIKSLEMKVEFGNSLNLGGFMIWSIETDDFRGNCGEKYPLLKAINNKLGNSQGTSGAEIEEVEIPVEPSKPDDSKPVKPEIAGDCSVDDFFANADDCNSFYQYAMNSNVAQVCTLMLIYKTAIGHVLLNVIINFI